MKIRSYFFLLAFLCFLTGCFSSHWKTYTSDEFGVSIDSPYPIKFKTRAVSRPDGSQSITLDGSSEWSAPSFFISMISDLLKHRKSAPPDVLSVFLYSTKGSNKCGDYDLDRVVANFLKIEEISGNKYYKNFRSDTVRTSCSGFPAALVTITEDTDRNGELIAKKYIKYFIAANTDQYWVVVCDLIDFHHDGINDFEMVTRRMIESIKIKNP